MSTELAIAYFGGMTIAILVWVVMVMAALKTLIAKTEISDIAVVAAIMCLCIAVPAVVLMLLTSQMCPR